MAAAAPRCQVQSSVGSGSERPPVGQRVVPVVVGVSYRNSSIAYRERLDRLLDARDWTRVAQADEWALVRTCNRIEFVLATSTPAAAAERLSRWVKKELGQTRFYVLEGHSAIPHLFRVASGLDSMGARGPIYRRPYVWSLSRSAKSAMSCAGANSWSARPTAEATQ